MTKVTTTFEMTKSVCNVSDISLFTVKDEAKANIFP